jgi:hypothetical protein
MAWDQSTPAVARRLRKLRCFRCGAPMRPKRLYNGEPRLICVRGCTMMAPGENGDGIRAAFKLAFEETEPSDTP